MSPQSGIFEGSFTFLPGTIDDKYNGGKQVATRHVIDAYVYDHLNKPRGVAKAIAAFILTRCPPRRPRPRSSWSSTRSSGA